MRLLTVLAAVVLMLVCASPALAVGPLVGTNCQILWTLPTTRVDGTLATGAITTNIWIMSGVQTLPGVPAKFTGVAGSSFIDCAGLAAGQYTAATDAIEAGIGVESAYSNMFAFMLVIPNAPVGFAVNSSGLATWPAVGTYTDNTAIAGPVTYELWLMPATATAPSGPPTLTSTGTSATLTTVAGKYNAFIRAMTTPTPGGSTSESAALASPFAVSSAALNPPTNVNVR